MRLSDMGKYVGRLTTFVTVLGAIAAACSGAGPQFERAHLDRSESALQSDSTQFMSYFGGPVADHVEVVPIYWGTNVNFASQLTGFYSAITQSPFIDWMAEYSTPAQLIERGHSCTAVTELAPPPAIVTDAQVQDEVRALIASGRVPPPNGERQYIVHLPPGVVSAIPLSPTFSLKSCVHYCAYHLAFTDAVSGERAYYSVLPDQTGGDACPRCANAELTDFDNTTQRASHQVASVVTDPASALFIDENDGTTGWAAHLNFDSEVGDECEGQFDRVAGYAVQKEWSNKQQGCVAQYASPANDFNLTTTTSPVVTLHPGQSVTTRVQLTVIHAGGRPIPVQVSAGPLPAGVHAALPSFTRSDKAFDLVLTADPSAAGAQQVPVTITATSAASTGAAGSVTSTTRVFITVAP